MVLIGAREFTIEAMHSACGIARHSGQTVALVKMVPVDHPGMLGTVDGMMNFDAAARDSLADYATIAEDYGVAVQTVPFQYVTLAGAVGDAADYVDAQIVFARLPEYLLPLWGKAEEWALNMRLAKRGRMLETLRGHAHGQQPRAQLGNPALAPISR
jgi:predicted trehalose synthase